jgi:hypothetical protein
MLRQKTQKGRKAQEEADKVKRNRHNTNARVVKPAQKKKSNATFLSTGQHHQRHRLHLVPGVKGGKKRRGGFACGDCVCLARRYKGIRGGTEYVMRMRMREKASKGNGT